MIGHMAAMLLQSSMLSMPVHMTAVHHSLSCPECFLFVSKASHIFMYSMPGHTVAVLLQSYSLLQPATIGHMAAVFCSLQ